MSKHWCKSVLIYHVIVYKHWPDTCVNSLHGLLNCDISGLDCRVITTEYRTRVHFIHMLHVFVMHWSMWFIREYLVNLVNSYIISLTRYTYTLTLWYEMLVLYYIDVIVVPVQWWKWQQFLVLLNSVSYRTVIHLSFIL